uniref:Uncharacterized protein n=1 Tax=Helianthus annuus TaxID=4232 RepID=A0A251TFC0_HELAN
MRLIGVRQVYDGAHGTKPKHFLKHSYNRCNVFIIVHTSYTTEDSILYRLCYFLLNVFNVFINDAIQVTIRHNTVIQYRALTDKASDAFYKLSNTRTQIQAYVFDGYTR